MYSIAHQKIQGSETLDELKKIENIADEYWDVIDPLPNIIQWFHIFNKLFFNNKIYGETTEIMWSGRLKTSAGITYFDKMTKRIEICLCEKILKYQPRRATIEILLHEMIHAYLFAIGKESKHDKEFKQLMQEIKHQFLNPPEFVYRCNGPCKLQSPFYGYFIREFKRAPSVTDKFYHVHQKYCDGKFEFLGNSPQKEEEKCAKRISERRKSIATDTLSKDNSSCKTIKRRLSEQLPHDPVSSDLNNSTMSTKNNTVHSKKESQTFEASIESSSLNPRVYLYRCNNDQCRNQSPHFGYLTRDIKRAINVTDRFYHAHKKYCEGKFEYLENPPKIEEIDCAIRIEQHRKTIAKFPCDKPSNGNSYNRPLTRSARRKELLDEPDR